MPRPARRSRSALGELGVHGDGTDLAIVSYGNGYYLSRQAEKILREQHGLEAPGDRPALAGAARTRTALLEAVAGCERILIVDECRRTGSQSEALMALFAERAPETPTARGSRPRTASSRSAGPRR